MLRISLFECSFCQSDVVHSCVVIVCGHVSFVDYAGDKAFVIQWALIFGLFFSSVTFVLRCDVVAVNKDFLVVVVNNAAHVRHAAVTHFHVVLVKDGVEIVVWWDAFLDQVEKGFGDVGLYICAVWGAKPDDVSTYIPFCGCGCVFLAVVEAFVESA